MMKNYGFVTRPYQSGHWKRATSIHANTRKDEEEEDGKYSNNIETYLECQLFWKGDGEIECL